MNLFSNLETLKRINIMGMSFYGKKPNQYGVESQHTCYGHGVLIDFIWTVLDEHKNETGEEIISEKFRDEMNNMSWDIFVGEKTSTRLSELLDDKSDSIIQKMKKKQF